MAEVVSAPPVQCPGDVEEAELPRWSPSSKIVVAEEEEEEEGEVTSAPAAKEEATATVEASATVATAETTCSRCSNIDHCCRKTRETAVVEGEEEGVGRDMGTLDKEFKEGLEEGKWRLRGRGGKVKNVSMNASFFMKQVFDHGTWKMFRKKSDYSEVS